MAEIRIGIITHYFSQLGVAAIHLTDGNLARGDTIRVKGHTTDLTQAVESLQMENADVIKAVRGQAVGIRLKEQARVRDEVFKVVPD